jgi:hypothetical protein
MKAIKTNENAILEQLKKEITSKMFIKFLTAPLLFQ